MPINWEKLSGPGLAVCRSYLDGVVMDVRRGEASIEGIVSILANPNQPQLNRDLLPIEHIESLAVMLGLAIEELAKSWEDQAVAQWENGR